MKAKRFLITIRALWREGIRPWNLSHIRLWEENGKYLLEITK
jgi:hypothetical protein